MALEAAAALGFFASLLSVEGVLAAGAFGGATIFPDAVSPLEILRIALVVGFGGCGPGRGIGIESKAEGCGDADGAVGIGIVIVADVVMPMTSLLLTSS